VAVRTPALGGFHQRQNTFVFDPCAEAFHQGGVVDAVERSHDTLPVSRRCRLRCG